ncbi:hypothetical protein VSR01_01335 [Actinacidiphila sp. DG2A-62]|uniref:hypothetical protein n=1 Tax=Actinacidiphila sp. DG2A-62 TaxID=3108821 RepID=UPI002DBF349D|nr:hypothetical protein [Actinacidiphila sp. DG2A-62]MEC3992259.1 hypothetical protein [Actinacidiphila sp. DG2A-62]
MLSVPDLDTRCIALMIAAAEERWDDIDPLISDLEPGALGTVVSGLAVLAVRATIPPRLHRDPAALARVADYMRAELLARATTDPQEPDRG